MFVVLEGVDGSGKSTNARMLVERLRSEGYDVVSTLEPGDTRIGKKIRTLLGETKSQKTSLWLFLADRQEHMQEVVLPALAAGKIVVCDRFYHSTLAYQGDTLPWETVKALNELAIGGVHPDLLLFYEADPDILMRRRSDENFDALDEKFVAMRRKVAERYERIIREEEVAYPGQIVRIDANTATIEEIHEQTHRAVMRRIDELGASAGARA